MRNPSSQPLRPPLPDVVRRVLSRCRLSYLSTVDVGSQSSHLSLMRFTYLPEEETIVMSTNVKTKKYDMLEQQSGVALLIHDFSESSAGEDASGASRLTGEYSITLNGTCSVVKDSTWPDVRFAVNRPFSSRARFWGNSVVLAEKYRAAHLENNPDYPQVRRAPDLSLGSILCALTYLLLPSPNLCSRPTPCSSSSEKTSPCCVLMWYLPEYATSTTR